MIKFTHIEYKNLNSIGNHPIKIQLDRSPNTLIGGPNGAGKSSMGYAIAFGLYGKFLNGVKLAQAINSTNKKGLLVKIKFEKNGEQWEVIRGEKPKKFEIYRDGTLLDQYANVRDQQAYLELILGMDYKLFTQLVVLNKERYVPFMELTAADRRKIIEDLLDISIFTEMNDIVKQKITGLKRDESTFERDYEVKKTELTGQQKLITQIQDTIKANSESHEQMITEKQDEIASLQQQIDDLQAQYDAIDVSDADKIKKQKSEFQLLATQFETKISEQNKIESFFSDNDVCPTCDQSIDDQIKQKKLSESKAKKSDIQTTLVDLMSELESVINRSTEIATLQSEQTKLNTSISVLNSQIKTLNSDILKMSRSGQNDDLSNKLSDAMVTYSKLEDELQAILEFTRDTIREREMYESLRELLKDDGIKAVIIKEYNALMNQKINEYLQAMNFYIGMRLDENFNESFGAINKEDFSYENLSSGQKTRVNFAIYLALMELASIKNSVVTNILFLDEMISAVDEEGIVEIYNLFKNLLNNKNIFIIEQRFSELASHAFSTIRFRQNQDGFTELE